MPCGDSAIMSQNSRRHRGFRTERVVAEYLSRIWENATVGRGMGKDVLGVPFDIEVKARSAISLPELMRQIEARTSKSGELGFGCLRLNGMGETADKYLAVIRLGDLVQLLIQSGYADYKSEIKETDVKRCDKCGNWMIAKCSICERRDNADI